MGSEYLVEMENISKRFSGVKALDNMNFKLGKGEIHALIGENGAGKSTLMNILAGAFPSDEGTIKIDGKIRKISSPKVSRELGISVIHQELMLAPHLTVAENIFIDRLSSKGGVINWKKLKQDAKDILTKLGFGDIDPNARIMDLSVAYQQVVEICKSLSRNVKILVLDEPTAVLTFNEIQKLFVLLRNIRDQGMGVIYISHRLEEIFELCDKITVMKDGCYIGDYDTKNISKDELIEKMVGRELTTLFPKRNAEIGDIVLEVKNLNAGRMVKNISFNIRKGEVVGFSGLVGAGRTETMRAIFGADKIDSGTITYFGKEVVFKSPYEAVKNGIGFLPEDRKQQGILLDMPIRNNVTLTALKKVTKASVIRQKADKGLAESILKEVSAKYHALSDKVSSLSGGNQQKVALSKWLAADCKLMILDEPTRGVDVGAKSEIYKIINDLAESGIAVIMISSEMEEILNMSDRVYVMRRGSITGELPKEDLQDVNIMKLCVGE
ncbi:sugar ABC transporter ATP-binding protein [Caproiciproducens galactitolivorans]|uniref:Ribose import ATP-binding protein RbsA n=1 Tax=Caproiciproducens galactitolivorans TaxID=642589 RepID=A0A4Z0YEH5_9FIRM|nr:sugar ABC transporter ATP-binding protein [Caproiciproducens galactitolivorans]QEY35531.1 sugar ABC transporter ATP-binding protein [Caproiciproducens galactitolivorans]TGJ77253.1 ribose import ATP-binding protein RbsA [Caproiciproducens galactitolivorans]